jgi:Tfp pilus assembly ATPase PilU
MPSESRVAESNSVEFALSFGQSGHGHLVIFDLRTQSINNNNELKRIMDNKSRNKNQFVKFV